jgi:hypothetical protein
MQRLAVTQLTVKHGSKENYMPIYGNWLSDENYKHKFN